MHDVSAHPKFHQLRRIEIRTVTDQCWHSGVAPFPTREIAETAFLAHRSSPGQRASLAAPHAQRGGDRRTDRHCGCFAQSGLSPWASALPPVAVSTWSQRPHPHLLLASFCGRNSEPDVALVRESCFSWRTWFPAAGFDETLSGQTHLSHSGQSCAETSAAIIAAMLVNPAIKHRPTRVIAPLAIRSSYIAPIAAHDLGCA